MESQLIQELKLNEFINSTGAKTDDALRCLQCHSYDIKKAIIDYNDTLTTEYFRDFNEKKYLHDSTEPPKMPETDYKKLYRGISTAMDNVNLVSHARTEIALDFDYENIKNTQIIDTNDYTFILPDLSNFSEDFRYFLETDLIDISALKCLEETKRLNWWVDAGLCRKLWPFSTTGDGNCLLHAASLYIWGFHDRKLTLRSALHEILSKGIYRDSLWRRWRFQQTKQNKKAGFVYSEIEWCKEWEEIVLLSSTAPRQINKGNIRRRSAILERNIYGSDIYESLEEIHVLALAHVLKRTIIVISDTVLRDLNGQAMAPISFGGIYLPYEIPPNECYKVPLLLTYNNAHFSALVSMDTTQTYPPALVPLIDLDNEILPIHFCIDPGKNFNWNNYDGDDGNWILSDQEHITLLKEYLIISYTGISENLDYEIFENLTDEEFEKGLHQADVILGSSAESNNSESQNKSSKAAKQLHSIAKQFGSIGKSVSKKIKKNIDSIAKKGSKKINSSESFNNQSRIPCAVLKFKRHCYYDQMIENYLMCAQIRFVESENALNKGKMVTTKKTPGSSSSAGSKTIKDVDTTNNMNSHYHHHHSFDQPNTSCQECKHDLPDNLMELIPKYDTGKSKFYMQADLKSHNSIKDLPFAKKLNELDQTIYLTNSTFFNDKLLTEGNSNKTFISSANLNNKPELIRKETSSATNNKTKIKDDGRNFFPSSS